MRHPALPCTVLCLALLAGCASRPTLPRLAPDESVSFEFWGRAAGGPLPLRNEEVGKDATVGAGAGGALGAAAGLGCGFLAIVCVPLFAGLGLGAGAATGGLVGLTGALPADKRERLLARVDQQLKAHDLRQDLEQEVLQRARQRWKIATDAATARALIEVRSIELTTNRDGQVGLNARVRTTVRLRAFPQGDPFQKEHACAVAPSSVDAWLDESGDHVARQLADCGRQLATQIVADLALP